MYIALFNSQCLLSLHFVRLALLDLADLASLEFSAVEKSYSIPRNSYIHIRAGVYYCYYQEYFVKIE